ncbi:hypothetical protein V8G54_005773 [Vigna mungo]|uniref:Uncharacterized protein n=1 Tax=Vigna mungo TaxID=3915 RepID=A0AAQ3S7E2_VIGMU
MLCFLIRRYVAGDDASVMMRGRMSRLPRILRVGGDVDGGWHRCRGVCKMKARQRRGLGDLGRGSRLVGANSVCVFRHNAIYDWGCSRFLDLSEFQVILGMPWRTHEEDCLDSLQVKNEDACLICGLDCCVIGVMVHEKRNRGCSVGEDERSSQAQATWQRVKREAASNKS